MFTPIGYFAPQGGLPNIVTDSLQIWADPNHSTVTYTSGSSAGNISNLIDTGYVITFGNVTSTPYDSSPISFTVGTAAGGEKYFLPNGSHPYGNDSGSVDQGFVDLESPYSMDTWIYLPTGTSSPYYYNFEGAIMNIGYRWPLSDPRSFAYVNLRRWSDATNRYKVNNFGFRNDANNEVEAASSPIGSTAYNDGQWHHFCITAGGAGGTGKFYIDGVDQGYSLSIPAGTSTNATLTYWGASGGGDYRTFQGGARGGSLRYYTKLLSPSEVLQNYNAEAGTFGS